VIVEDGWGLGGGIALFGGGDLQDVDSRISGNSVVPPAATGNAVAFGGNAYGLGVVNALFKGSEISSGKALKGGGVYWENVLTPYGALGDSLIRFVNATISGNAVDGNGANGGAAALVGKVQVGFLNATLYANRNLAGDVAGVYLDTGANGPDPTASFQSTISYADGSAFDFGVNLARIPVPAVTASNSLFGKLPFYASVVGDGNLQGRDPLLGPLAFNGSLTPARNHALLPGSPAIDAGSNPLKLATDQRGVPYRRAAGSAPDIGAFEVPLNARR